MELSKLAKSPDELAHVEKVSMRQLQCMSVGACSFEAALALFQQAQTEWHLALALAAIQQALRQRDAACACVRKEHIIEMGLRKHQTCVGAWSYDVALLYD